MQNGTVHANFGMVARTLEFEHDIVERWRQIVYKNGLTQVSKIYH